MTNEEKNAALADKLREQGVTDEVIEYVLSKNPSKVLSIISDFLLIFLLILGFAVGAVLWVAVGRYSGQAALEHALSIGGVMYEDIFGFSGLAALFGWICASGFITYSPQLNSERLIVSAFAYSLADNSKKSGSWRRTYLKADKSLEPEILTRWVFASQGKWMKWPAIMLFLVAFPLLELELKLHTIYTTEGFVERSEYGLGDWSNVSWTGVVSVELGCNHVTGRSKSDDPVYKINFADSRSIRLDNARSVRGSWIDGIEVIDAALVSGGAEFKRWSWPNRNPLHPECLAADRAKMSPEDFARLLTLMRVPS